MRAAISDWEEFALRYGASDPEEFSLNQLGPGDVLRVVTEHTNYLFTVITDSEAACNVHVPTGHPEVSGSQGADSVFRTRSSRGIFFVVAAWSSRF